MTKEVPLTAVARRSSRIAACGSAHRHSQGRSTHQAHDAHGLPPGFNNTFSAMAALKALAAKGTGKVAVILPDTVSSARYVDFDAPYLKKALENAGLAVQNIVQNARAVTPPSSPMLSRTSPGAKVLV